MPSAPRARRSRAVRAAARLALLAWVLPASGAPAAVWVDAVGRTVEVRAAPARVVSLAPSVTETLFALGAAGRLAGVTEQCDYPPEARAKPRVGTYAEPSVEAIVALQPDLVIASADSTPPSAVFALESAGLTVYTVHPRTLSEALEAFRTLGAVLGLPAAGEALVREFTAAQRRIGEAVAALGPAPRPRVLFCVMVNPLVVAGPHTVAHDLVEAAGGDNVVPPGPSRYPTWGMESVLAADPDVIVASPHPGEPEPSAVFGSWRELRAVRAGRVAAVDPDWVHRPGPRMVLGLTALAEALHGPQLAAVLRR